MNGEGRIKVKTWPYLEMINCAPIFLITALNNTFCQAFSVKPRLRTIDPGVMQTTEYSLLKYLSRYLHYRVLTVNRII